MRQLLCALLLAGCASPTAPVSSVTTPGPAIVRNTPDAGPDVQVAAYIRLANSAPRADRLVRLTCVCADSVEIHETANRAMHTLPHLDIPAGGELEIVPGGPTHLMLMGLGAPIQPGERVSMTLEFDHAPPLTAEFIAVENSREGWTANDPRR
jgi:copper(I)-binding protein